MGSCPDTDIEPYVKLLECVSYILQRTQITSLPMDHIEISMACHHPTQQQEETHQMVEHH